MEVEMSIKSWETQPCLGLLYRYRKLRLRKAKKLLKPQEIACGFSDSFMPAAGLEPARSCLQQILSLPRLPFRHAGFFCNPLQLLHLIISIQNWQANF